MLLRVVVVTFIVCLLVSVHIHSDGLYLGTISLVREELGKLKELEKTKKRDSPPVVFISSPAAGSTISGKVDIIVMAYDDKGIAKVEFLVDGEVKFVATFTSTPPYYVWSWDTTQYTNGLHVIKIVVYDTINQTASAHNIVTVENRDRDTPPTAIIIEPPEGSTVTTTTRIVKVVVMASDDRGINKVEFYVDESLKFITTSTAPPYSWDWDITQYSEGFHILKVVVYDTINQMTVAQRTVLIKRPDDDISGDTFIRNGNFEEGYGAFPNVPKYWEPEQPHKNYSSVLSLDQVVVYEGRYSLRMTAPASGEWDVGPIFQTSGYNTVIPGKTYELTAWIKSEGKMWPNEWYVIGLLWLTNDGQPLGEATIPEEDRSPVNYDWKKFTIRAVAPAGADRLRVKLQQHFGHGTTWFDDIRVRRVD